MWYTVYKRVREKKKIKERVIIKERERGVRAKEKGNGRDEKERERGGMTKRDNNREIDGE